MTGAPASADDLVDKAEILLPGRLQSRGDAITLRDALGVRQAQDRIFFVRGNQCEGEIPGISISSLGSSTSVRRLRTIPRLRRPVPLPSDRFPTGARSGA